MDSVPSIVALLDREYRTTSLKLHQIVHELRYFLTLVLLLIGCFSPVPIALSLIIGRPLLYMLFDDAFK